MNHHHLTPALSINGEGDKKWRGRPTDSHSLSLTTCLPWAVGKEWRLIEKLMKGYQR